MLKRLRIKFICILMSVVTVLLCVIFGLVIHFTRQNLLQESNEALKLASRDPGFAIGQKERSAVLPYFIIRRDSWGVAHVSGTIQFDQYEDDVIQQIWNTASDSGNQTGEIQEYDLRYMRVNAPGREGYVFVDVTSHRMAMESLTGVCVIVGMVSFVVLLALSILLSNWLVKPVESAWQQQRQFVADASHELKTPLTVIMTNAELLQSPEYDEKARKGFSDSILTMSYQMRGLVNGLLELARVDNGAVKTSFGTVDLSTLAAEGMLPFEPLYFEKGLTLSGAVQSGIQCKGSPTHLGQVLEILLDNAMKYSRPEGEVRVSLTRQGNHCLLTVASPGEAISQEDLKNIFKRFYRIDKARKQDGSYGLGLSIAQRIVEEHGGRIWAESAGGVNTFHVQLPLG